MEATKVLLDLLEAIVCLILLRADGRFATGSEGLVKDGVDELVGRKNGVRRVDSAVLKVFVLNVGQEELVCVRLGTILGCRLAKQDLFAISLLEKTARGLGVGECVTASLLQGQDAGQAVHERALRQINVPDK